MPYLVETAQMPAIPKGAKRLTALTMEEAVMFDERKGDLIKRNGGWGDWIIEMRHGVFTYLRNTEWFPFKQTK